MTLTLPIRVHVVRLNRARCTECKRRRVLFTVQVEHEPAGDEPATLVVRVGSIDGVEGEIEGLSTSPRVARSSGIRIVGLAAEALCGECAGIQEREA